MPPRPAKVPNGIGWLRQPVDRFDRAIGQHQIERRYRLREDRRVDRAAMHIHRRHASEAEEATGRDCFQHEIVLRQEGVQLVLSNARVHRDLHPTRAQQNALVAIRSQVFVARHIHEVRRGLLWRRVTVVIDHQRRLRMTLPGDSDLHAPGLCLNKHGLQFREVGWHEVVLHAIGRAVQKVPAPVFPGRRRGGGDDCVCTVRHCGIPCAPG